MTLKASSVLFAFIVFQAFGQKPITYTLNMDNIHHHELKVSVIFDNLETDVLEIKMPNASPGRYAAHNFAKNVYEEKAFDKKGDKLKVTRKTPLIWVVEPQKGYVRFEYTLYGNHGDGTYTGIDARKLHLNMPASFVYGDGLQDRPVHLAIDLSDYPEWSVATQLVREDEYLFSAPNYYYFYDSPTMVGEISWRRWQAGDQTIEIAMMHEGTEAELDQYTKWTKSIVAEEQKVFGELPPFDYGRYTFLMSYNPWVHGDGMEHRNSTICSSSSSLAERAGQLIGTVAHEFFHCWNVERIRPASLEPFDFDRANLSGELWFAEGFTSYYDDLILCRTGIHTPETYVAGLSGTMNYVLNSPGRTMRTPIQMSYNAPFVDAATANDETNYANNFISYYSYGAVLGLGLDLLLRTTFEKVTLDDYMKYVWENYGKPERPYTIPDLENALAEVSGDKKFAKDFFAQYIYESKLPDFKALLKQFGIEMTLNSPDQAFFGTNVNKGVVNRPVVRGSALYDAGVEKGDKILSINGSPVNADQDIDSISYGLEPGNRYIIEYEQLGEKKTGEFVAVQNPSFRLTWLPDAELNAKQLSRRNAWLEEKQ